MQEAVPAPDDPEKLFVEATPHPVERAVARAVDAETRREDQREKTRPKLLIALACAWAVMVVVAIVAAFINDKAFDNLLKLYAVVVPLLTAALGGAFAHYFGKGGSGSS